MTPERRAEFDELVDALERAYGAFLTVPFGRRSEALSEKLIAARAALTAFVEAEEGEEYEVENLDCGACSASPDFIKAGILLPLNLGDRVRVTRMEEDT